MEEFRRVKVVHRNFWCVVMTRVVLILTIEFSPDRLFLLLFLSRIVLRTCEEIPQLFIYWPTKRDFSELAGKQCVNSHSRLNGTTRLLVSSAFCNQEQIETASAGSSSASEQNLTCSVPVPLKPL